MLVLLAGCAAQPPDVRVIEKFGEIQIYDKDHWIDLNIIYLKCGDKVRIGPRSKLKIELRHENVVILKENTLLMIGKQYEIEISALALCRG